MKTKQITILLLLLTFSLTKAQVKDISFTLSPAAEYTWWDNKAGIEDNFLVGGKLGFGFGEFVELRAIYLQSLNTKTSFKEYGFTGYDDALFNARDLEITRWGGEFKANFGTKGIRPYFTLGAGVQNIGLKNAESFEQVYGTLGLGAKFKIANRIVFTLEAKNTTYNFNSGMKLLSDNDKNDFGVSDSDFSNERLSNWSLQASVQFYLGGRKPGTLSELDKAYLQNFKGGFKGIQWVIEPSLAYTAFDNNSLFRDTYWLGGYAGLDLNEYIGVRAFYFQATENNEISTNFDKMAMYGGEFRARLNDGNGVTPFLILGGGYLNPSSNYVPKPNANGTFSTLEGGAFATGGLGLNIPLSKYILITGGARAMITSGENVADISNTDDIQTHIFYNAGLKFTLGKKAVAPNTIYQENLDNQISIQQKESNDKIAKLKQEYQSKIKTLESDLKDAYQAKDVEKAVQILEEKKQVEESLEGVVIVEKVQKEKVIKADENTVKVEKADTIIEDSRLIKMTSAQLETLIQRILTNLDETSTIKKDTILSVDTKKTIESDKVNQLTNRVETLEKLLLQVNKKQDSVTNNLDKTNTDNLNKKQQVKEMNDKIIDKIDVLNKKIDDKKSEIKNKETAVVTPVLEKNEDLTVVENDTLVKLPAFKQNNNSVIIGYNSGTANTTNIGYRMHYAIPKTKFEFMPEAIVGFGDATTWAVSANAIYPFSIGQDMFKPYAGAGIGFGDLSNGTTTFYNVVLGTTLPILNENLYIDYTMRNTFDDNQIAIGYRFKF